MSKSSSKTKDKIRILLADDHHIVRAGVKQLLESASDLQVIAEAGDGEEAQALIQKHRPDIAVLDIQMPKASGIEVTRWVRSHLPEVGILILTAYDDDPYVMAVLQAGANGYVLKTAHADDLIQAVHDVYEGTALDPTITRKLMSSIFKGPEKKIVDSLTDREHLPSQFLAVVGKGFLAEDKEIANFPLALGVIGHPHSVERNRGVDPGKRRGKVQMGNHMGF